MTFHQNWIGLFEAIAAYRSGATCWYDDDIFMAYTGMSVAVFNTAIITDLSSLTTERVADISATFRARKIPYSVQFSTQQEDHPYGPLLEKAGLMFSFSDPLRLRNGPLRIPSHYAAQAKHIETMPVSTSQHHADYIYAVIRSFDLLPSADEFLRLMLDMRECFHVVAYLDGRLAGAGSLVKCRGVAGVYNVATLPFARRQGIGIAVMAALHGHALACGYAGTALAASAMGIGLYEALGYIPDGYQHAYAYGGLF
jgi:GNAT superfamily N-acetyltransferase